MQFTDDEIEVIKNLIKDFGFEYGIVSDLAKVRQLAKKLDMDKHYTEEL